MIHKALRVIRQFHSIKQSDLASELGMSKSQIVDIESGRKPVTMQLLEQYAARFDISVSSLVFFSESLQGNRLVSEKFRQNFAGKTLSILEWFTEGHRDEKKDKNRG